MAKASPPTTRTALMAWALRRADELARELKRARSPSYDPGSLDDVRASIAALLKCGDFVLELHRAGTQVERPRLTAPEYLALDIGQLRTLGLLTAAPAAGSLALAPGNIVLRLQVEAMTAPDALVLHIEADGAEQSITVTSTNPSFGGARQWLRCPGLERPCGERALRLYRTLDDPRFACRACHRNLHDRGWRTLRDRKVHVPFLQAA